MELTVRYLVDLLGPPRRVSFADSYVYRFDGRTAREAMLQKLVRVVSGLRAADILREAGYVQEQAVIQRVLDEINEDIQFLSGPALFDVETEHHQTYLNSFFEEEADSDSGELGAQNRPMVPRKKIRAYIAKIQGPSLDPSTGAKLARQLSKGYSGYVHAASPQIMEMFGGDPPQFAMNGMLATERHDEHSRDLWNQFFRSNVAFALASKAFGNEIRFETHRDIADEVLREMCLLDANEKHA